MKRRIEERYLESQEIVRDGERMAIWEKRVPSTIYDTRIGYHRKGQEKLMGNVLAREVR